MTGKNRTFSYPDLKIKIAERILESYYFCEKRCYTNRNITKGSCSVENPKMASEFMHRVKKLHLYLAILSFFQGVILSVFTVKILI